MLQFSEIFEFSKKKFRKIPILKEFEWFEWFEWFVRSLADRTFQLRWPALRRRVPAAAGAPAAAPDPHAATWEALVAVVGRLPSFLLPLQRPNNV